MRGFVTSRRAVVVVICGLVVLLLSSDVPLPLVLPIAFPFTNAMGGRAPSSTIEPLHEFTKDSVINVSYNATGTAGSSGVFWTELWYRVAGEANWALYAPPWNPEGRWFGALGFTATRMVEGTIPFDTFFARGEAFYEFYTVAVDRGFKEEPPARDAKANTTLDTRPPQLFVARPTPDAWTNAQEFAWSATDEVSGLAGVTAVLDDVALEPFEVPLGAKEAAGARPLALDGEGDHAVSVRAVDRAGNAADVFVPFHYDPTAPTLVITAPARDSYTNALDVDVTWTAEDSGAGMAGFRLAVDSNAPASLSAEVRTYRLEAPTERGHIVSLLAMDAAGNFAAETISFAVDRTPPTVLLVSPRPPEAYSNVEGRLQVLWTGTDAGSGIAQFVAELVEAGLQSPGLESAAGYTFEGIDQDEYTVRVTAVDRAGNTAEATGKVTVDWMAPRVTITSPARSATVYRGVQVNWTVEEGGSGLGMVELIIDGGTAIPATGATTLRISPNPSDGAHVVVVRAWDRAGNMGEAILPFDFRLNAPTTPLGLPGLDFWILMLIIGAIAVGSAYFAVRRRKKTQA